MSDTTDAAEGVNDNVQFLADQVRDLLSSGAEITSEAVQELLTQVHYYGIALTALGAIQVVAFGICVWWITKNFPKACQKFDDCNTECEGIGGILISIVLLIIGIIMSVQGFDNLHDGIMAMGAPILYVIQLINGA